MNFLRSIVETAAANALGWALLHSLWQAALAALIVAFVLGATRSPRIRYAAACLALLASAATLLISFAVFLPHDTGAPTIPDLTTATAHSSLAGAPQVWIRNSAALPWLAPIWLMGVLSLQLRAVAGWYLVNRIRNAGSIAVAPEWMLKLNQLKDRMQVTLAVQLLESVRTEGPVVIGYLRPAILLPVGLLTGMPAHQVEAILIHELAHIRRHDYLINLFQTVAENLLFYHPAVWWMSRIARNERENCCDDLAVALSGNGALEYVRALAALEENRSTDRRSLAMAATGGTLMSRIHRLLAPAQDAHARFAPGLTACLLAVTIAMATAAVPASPLKIMLQKKSAAAATPYQRWIAEDVVYIATADEKAAFEKLRTDDERNQFITQFWDRRNPTPGAANNPFKEEHYRRIAYSNDRFRTLSLPGWGTDRGRIYILYGPPDEIESHPTSKGNNPPFEQWRYHYIAGVGTNVIIEFVDVDGTGQYRMTTDPSRK